MSKTRKALSLEWGLLKILILHKKWIFQKNKNIAALLFSIGRPLCFLKMQNFISFSWFKILKWPLSQYLSWFFPFFSLIFISSRSIFPQFRWNNSCNQSSHKVIPFPKQNKVSELIFALSVKRMMQNNRLKIYFHRNFHCVLSRLLNVSSHLICW